MKHAVHVMYLGSCSRQREALATKWTRCGVCQLDEGEAEAGRGIALGEGGAGGGVKAGQQSLPAALKLWPRSLRQNNASTVLLMEAILKHSMYIYRLCNLSIDDSRFYCRGIHSWRIYHFPPASLLLHLLHENCASIQFRGSAW